MSNTAQLPAPCSVVTLPWQSLRPSNLIVAASTGWDVTAHLDTVLDSLSDYAVLTLDVAGNVTSWNSGAARTKGYTKGEIIGQNFSIFYPKADQDAGLPLAALQIAANSGKHKAEGWRVRKNGEQFWASVIIHPVTDDAGTIQGYVKVTRDISQRLQIEKLRDELGQSKKLEMVGQLTGGVAHDFNNLLTTIEAAHELVLGYSDDHRIARVVGIGRGAVDRSRKLIAQLLAFSRRQLLNPKAANVWDIVTGMNALVERAVGESIQLEWSLQPALPHVMIDHTQFQAMLLNLIVNARDAMPDGGKLTVFMEKVSLTENNFEAPYDVPAGDYIVLGISDTGEGMSPDVRERAIEPFFTTKDVGRGTGLGLSQCFGFARQSGGTLRIESTQGNGTTVRILLPSLRPLPVLAVREESCRTVLLVDDDTSVRMLVREMLTVMGHKVIEAHDGREALHRLRQDHSIDYLFTDIIMPNDMNGVQLMQAARAARPGLPALLTSGYPREALRDIGDIPEDVAFISKPYCLADVHAHIGGRSLH